MSKPSRPVLRLVSTTDAGAGDALDAFVDELGLAPGSLGPPGGSATAIGRSDVVALRGEVAADVARLADRAGPAGSTDLHARWDALRGRCDPADLAHLADQARSLREAAESVRRQHTETADDLGPLWDSWAGPAAEAVQDRVSALARSAHALVAELQATADRLADAHDQVVLAVETLADDLAERPSGTPAPDLAGPWDQAASTCARAWEDARRVLAGEG